MGVARPLKQDEEPVARTIGADREEFADQLVLERPIGRCRDSSRRLGIFSTAEEQEPMRVHLYGFIKRVNLTSTGSWNRLATKLDFQAKTDHYSYHIPEHVGRRTSPKDSLNSRVEAVTRRSTRS